MSFISSRFFPIPYTLHVISNLCIKNNNRTFVDYASKVDDPNLNINEQVITTVYDEVELLIGYRINYVSPYRF